MNQITVDSTAASASGPSSVRTPSSSSRTIARYLDDLVRIPGTNRRIGLDSVMGLIPGVGDVAGSAISAVIVVDAIRCRVPIVTLALMGWNILFDAFLGLIPFVGDVADVFHKASRKNMKLLQRSVEKHPSTKPPSVGYILAAMVLVIAPLVLGVVVGLVALVLLIRWAL